MLKRARDRCDDQPAVLTQKKIKRIKNPANPAEVLKAQEPQEPREPQEPPDRQVLTEEDLKVKPPSASFSPASGVEVSKSGISATLKSEKSQLLISNDWISPTHEQKTRSWTVQCSGKINDSYSTFVGITEVAHRGDPGFSVLFDANGHARYSKNLSELGFVYTYDKRDYHVCIKGATEFKDPFPVKEHKIHNVVVTMDIETRVLEVKFCSSTIKVHLDKMVQGTSWPQARLAVLLQPGSDEQRKVKIMKTS